MHNHVASLGLMSAQGRGLQSVWYKCAKEISLLLLLEVFIQGRIMQSPNQCDIPEVTADIHNLNLPSLRD